MIWRGTDEGSRALYDTLFGNKHGDETKIWDREPDLPRLRRARQAFKSDPARGLPELTALAQAGSPMAMVYVGDALQKGTGAAVDRSAALAWFQRAADTGCVPAFSRLGLLLWTAKEFAQARDAFEQGIAAGSGLCVYNFGLLCGRAPEPYRDVARARELLTQAAAAGNAFAMGGLGRLLMRGHFGLLNRARGVWILLRAMKRGGLAIAQLLGAPKQAANSGQRG